jgi:hypothetical protein
MNISGPQSLLNFIGSDNIPSVSNLRSCILSVGNICSCQKQKKIQKSEECNNIYIQFVNSNCAGLLEYFKSKTSDDTIIFTHGSNHEIKRFKLH